MTRRDYYCPTCTHVVEVQVDLLQDEVGEVYCPHCKGRLVRYFGRQQGPLINFGFRESRYPTREDANIAKYQFTHL